MSRYSSVWVGFFVSAISNHTGAMVGCFEDGGYWQAVYFMMQPVGIMAEDFAVFLGKAAGIRESGSSFLFSSFVG